ncbi:MAG: T9SS type A sorting domain-containing protein, partial [Bacteroidota bacterium]|nr:T9SS type A sorting domain-containing protein [Bacteroidota bacterium]
TITGEAPDKNVVGNLSTSRTITRTSGSDFGGMGISIGLGSLGSQDLGVTVVNRLSGPGSSIIVGGNEGINRRWTVFPASQPTKPIDVTLSWVSDDDNGKNLSMARVWKTQGDDEGTFYDVSKVDQNAGNRQISTVVNSFSTLTVSDRNNPLPVELISFDVVKQGPNARLTWQTATEKNSLGFGIELSTDAKNFKEVGFVKSVNPNSNTIQNYEFIQRAALSGTVYYRLRQTDWNGVIQYFGPRAIQFGPVATAVVFPNPVSDRDAEITVQGGKITQEEVKITVTDALGKVVYKQTEAKNLTRNELKVNVRHLPAGVYVVTISTPTHSSQTKIVKQ